MRATIRQFCRIIVARIKEAYCNIKADVCNCPELPPDIVYEKQLNDMRDELLNKMNAVFEEHSADLAKSIDALSHTIDEIKRHG